MIYRLGVRFLIEKNTMSASNLLEMNIGIIGASYDSIITKHQLDYNREKYKYIVKAYFTSINNMVGKIIEGSSVYNINDISSVLKILNIDALIISDSKELNSELKDNVLKSCQNLGINLIEKENIDDWANLNSKKKNLKDINIEDLLKRDPINLDINTISNQLLNKTILVTGAAGSIGSELCLQILNFKPQHIILLDQAETPLFDTINFLDSINNSETTTIIPVIADISDYNRINKVFEKYTPQIVFHAGAYKHVPLMEENPYEAIKTNFIGSCILADLASEFKCERFVFISTDKAVNPTNVMGATKRISEMYIQSKDSEVDTIYITTRFGNVLGSNGSVIPTFKRMIEKGGPVLVTHKDITRFFMTIPEASQLVLEAGATGNGGEIFIFDMGEPVKIYDLAEDMIKMYGLVPNQDIKIEFSGLRPGEKLYEELLADKETTNKTHHEKIMIGKKAFSDFGKINELYNFMLKNINNHDNFSLVKKIKEIVPEYISNNSEFEQLDI